MFLSSRAIAQASATRDYLHTLNQDGETLPAGPVIISPDGLFPSLYRELVGLCIFVGVAWLKVQRVMSHCSVHVKLHDSVMGGAALASKSEIPA